MCFFSFQHPSSDDFLPVFCVLAEVWIAALSAECCEHTALSMKIPYTLGRRIDLSTQETRSTFQPDNCVRQLENQVTSLRVFQSTLKLMS